MIVLVHGNESLLNVVRGCGGGILPPELASAAVRCDAVHDVDRPAGELSYWLVAEARGRGLAYAAVRLMMASVVAGTGLPSVVLDIEAGNVASERLAERLGAERRSPTRVEVDRTGVARTRCSCSRSRRASGPRSPSSSRRRSRPRATLRPSNRRSPRLPRAPSASRSGSRTRRISSRISTARSPPRSADATRPRHTARPRHTDKSELETGIVAATGGSPPPRAD